MKVIFNPPKDQRPVGVMSFASWENADLQQALRIAFGESPRERITEIIVDERGISAIFAKVAK